jgi:hypothetical protein
MHSPPRSRGPTAPVSATDCPCSTRLSLGPEECDRDRDSDGPGRLRQPEPASRRSRPARRSRRRRLMRVTFPVFRPLHSRPVLPLHSRFLDHYIPAFQKRECNGRLRAAMRVRFPAGPVVSPFPSPTQPFDRVRNHRAPN